MTQLAVVVAVTLVAAAAAALVQRRARGAPVRVRYEAPPQLHRPDFERPDAAWLVAVFTSATCDTCAAIWAKCEVLASDDVAVHNVEYRAQRDLHERYAIDAVPLVVMADRAGVVQRAFFGPTSASELWAALADLREADRGAH